MPRAKIDPDVLRSLLSSGMSQAEAARHFGVSKPAISLRVKQLQIDTSKVVALERASAVVDQQLSAADRLARIQQVILDQLDWAVDQASQPGVDRPAFINLFVTLSTEVRNQLRLELDISRSLVDLKVVREFQQTVVKVIAQQHPDVARQIVARLKEQRALRRSVDLPALDGRGTLDVA